MQELCLGNHLYGHMVMTSSPVPCRGITVTTAVAESILLKGLTQYEAAIADKIKVRRNDNEFATLISIVFNVDIDIPKIQLF